MRVLAHELKENRQAKMADIAELLPVDVSTRTARRRAHEIGFHNRVAVKKPFVNEKQCIDRLELT